MGNLPLIQETNFKADPAQLFRAISQRPYSFLLDSGMDPKRLGQFSFMGSDPFLTFCSKGKDIWIRQEGHTLALQGNPFDVLQELLHRYRLPRRDLAFPFFGGAVGYFGYDLGGHLEHLPDRAADDPALPDCCLGFYDVIAVVDHQRRKVYLASTGLPEEDPCSVSRRARKRLEQMAEHLGRHSRHYEPPPAPGRGMRPVNIQSNFTRDEYCRTVSKAKQYIAAGDIYQVNLSQRMTSSLTVEPYDLFMRLRRINPAPFASYLRFGEVTVASASPERFIRLTGDAVETRPIKGTRPRGQDRRIDQLLRQELWNSEKDRAELTMIIDLERNDLGRICRTGTVRVPELYRLEEYPTVFHLVSTVAGTLPPGKDIVDLLKVTFPGGSITGAPKIRAMEIIEELEPVKRGIYTGSIGYIGFNGDADLNIVIRTFVIHGKKVYFQVGGGIIADSEPEAEYQETLDKAAALFRALQQDARSANKEENR